MNVYVTLSLAMFFWGLSYIWYKQAYPEFAPITVIILRLIISFSLLLITALLSGSLQLPKIGDLKYFMLLALFEPFLYFVGESYGMKYVSSSLASIIIASIPLLTPFVSYLFYREKLARNNYMGIIISSLGVLIVINVEGQLGKAPWFGILLMLLAVFSTLGYTVVLKKLSDQYRTLNILIINSFFGIIYFLPLFLLMDLKIFSFSNYSFRDYLPIFFLAIFASTFAFLFFIDGIKRIGIARSVVFTNLIPIVTVSFASILLSEPVTLGKCGGILLTIIGLFMSQGNVFNKIISKIRPK